MEHLEGESLADRLGRGALPLDEALRVGAQVADALDKAHRQGIVHRDLKPGNVMLTRSGAKLLDFGLAKVGLDDTAGELGATAAPTRASLTQAGAILGTFQYMAPEQLEGKEADARTDLFAFGVMFYEMLAGRRAFESESQARLISAIMTAQPAPLDSVLPDGVSPAVSRVVTSCLEKDPDERRQSAGDLKRELAWIASGGADSQASSPGAVSVPAPVRTSAPAPAWLPWSVAVLGLVLGAVGWLARTPSDEGQTYVSVGVQPSAQLGGPVPWVTRTEFALTADGRTVVFAGAPEGSQVLRLYRRDLDQPQAVPIDGTEGARMPVLSPDDQWVAYVAGRAIHKVRLDGGLPVEVGGVPWFPRGIDWGDDDTIAYDHREGISSMPADGGAPTALTVVDDAAEEVFHLLPSLLPGSEAVLFTVQRSLFQWDQSDVVVERIGSGERQVLVEGAADARYVDSGHLLFVREATLMAVPFDLERLEVTGGEVALVQDVSQSINLIDSDGDTGAAQYDVSAGGHLMYLSGGVPPDSVAQLAWVGTDGAVTPLFDERAAYWSVRLSPDGRRIAYTTTGRDAGVWVRDLERGVTTRLSDGLSLTAIWTRDGRAVTFDRVEREFPNLHQRVADASQPAEPLRASDAAEFPAGWTVDGQLLFSDNGDRLSLWNATDGTVTTLSEGEGNAVNPELSPDGRWMAYSGWAGDRFQIFVRPFPGPGPRTQVSIQGGYSPKWSEDGREISYVSYNDAENPDSYMMRVDIQTGAELEIGQPEQGFGWRYGMSRPVSRFDRAPDGRYLIGIHEQTEPPPRTHLRLITSWVDELPERVPGQ